MSCSRPGCCCGGSTNVNCNSIVIQSTDNSVVVDRPSSCIFDLSVDTSGLVLNRQSSNTITFQGNGSTTPLIANVVVSPTVGNILTAELNGLFVGGTPANNGLSKNVSTSVLGQDLGDVSNPAILLNNRQVPMGGFSITFSDANFNNVLRSSGIQATNSTGSGSQAILDNVGGAKLQLTDNIASSPFISLITGANTYRLRNHSGTLKVGNTSDAGVWVDNTGEIRFTQYPNTRNDGSTTKAVFFDAAGNVKYGDISTAGVGTVTSFVFTDGGGLDGTVTTATTTPTLSIKPSFSGWVRSDGNAFLAGIIGSGLTTTIGGSTLVNTLTTALDGGAGLQTIMASPSDSGYLVLQGTTSATPDAVAGIRFNVNPTIEAMRIFTDNALDARLLIGLTTPIGVDNERVQVADQLVVFTDILSPNYIRLGTNGIEIESDNATSFTIIRLRDKGDLTSEFTIDKGQLVSGPRTANIINNAGIVGSAIRMYDATGNIKYEAAHPDPLSTTDRGVPHYFVSHMTIATNFNIEANPHSLELKSIWDVGSTSQVLSIDVTDTGVLSSPSSSLANWKFNGTTVLRVDRTGKTALGNVAVSAVLTLPAGIAAATNAPLKFTSGINLTTPETGAVEYNGTNLFFTRTGTTREVVWTGNGGATAPTTTPGGTVTNRYGGDTNFLGDPVAWASVNINGTVYKIPLYT